MRVYATPGVKARVGASSTTKDDMQLKTPRADASFGTPGDLTPRILKVKEKRVVEEAKKKVRVWLLDQGT